MEEVKGVEKTNLETNKSVEIVPDTKKPINSNTQDTKTSINDCLTEDGSNLLEEDLLLENLAVLDSWNPEGDDEENTNANDIKSSSQKKEKCEVKLDQSSRQKQGLKKRSLKGRKAGSPQNKSTREKIHEKSRRNADRDRNKRRPERLGSRRSPKRISSRDRKDDRRRKERTRRTSVHRKRSLEKNPKSLECNDLKKNVNLRSELSIEKKCKMAENIKESSSKKEKDSNHKETKGENEKPSIKSEGLIDGDTKPKDRSETAECDSEVGNLRIQKTVKRRGIPIISSKTEMLMLQQNERLNEGRKEERRDLRGRRRYVSPYRRSSSIGRRHISLSRRSSSIGRRHFSPSRRSSRIGRRHGSPSRRSLSLGKRHVSPSRRSSSIGRRHILPYSRSPSIRRRHVSPSRRSLSLGRRHGSPSRRSSSIGRRHGSPSRRSSSIGRRHGSPSRRSSSIGRRHGSPSRRSLSIGRRHGSPRKRSSSIGRRHGSPSRRSSSIGRRHGSPSRRSSSIGRRHGSPSRRSSSIGRRHGSPSRRSSSIGRRHGSPSRRSSSIGRRYGSPSRRSSSIGRRYGSPSRRSSSVGRRHSFSRENRSPSMGRTHVYYRKKRSLSIEKSHLSPRERRSPSVERRRASSRDRRSRSLGRRHVSPLERRSPSLGRRRASSGERRSSSMRRRHSSRERRHGSSRERSFGRNENSREGSFSFARRREDSVESNLPLLQRVRYNNKTEAELGRMSLERGDYRRKWSDERQRWEVDEGRKRTKNGSPMSFDRFSTPSLSFELSSVSSEREGVRSRSGSRDHSKTGRRRHRRSHLSPISTNGSYDESRSLSSISLDDSHGNEELRRKRKCAPFITGSEYVPNKVHKMLPFQEYSEFQGASCPTSGANELGPGPFLPGYSSKADFASGYSQTYPPGEPLPPGVTVMPSTSNQQIHVPEHQIPPVHLAPVYSTDRTRPFKQQQTTRCIVPIPLNHLRIDRSRRLVPVVDQGQLSPVTPPPPVISTTEMYAVERGRQSTSMTTPVQDMTTVSSREDLIVRCEEAIRTLQADESSMLPGLFTLKHTIVPQNENLRLGDTRSPLQKAVGVVLNFTDRPPEFQRPGSVHMQPVEAMKTRNIPTKKITPKKTRIVQLSKATSTIVVRDKVNSVDAYTQTENVTFCSVGIQVCVRNPIKESAVQTSDITLSEISRIEGFEKHQPPGTITFHNQTATTVSDHISGMVPLQSNDKPTDAINKLHNYNSYGGSGETIINIEPSQQIIPFMGSINNKSTSDAPTFVSNENSHLSVQPSVPLQRAALPSKSPSSSNVWFTEPNLPVHQQAAPSPALCKATEGGRSPPASKAVGTGPTGLPAEDAWSRSSPSASMNETVAATNTSLPPQSSSLNSSRNFAMGLWDNIVPPGMTRKQYLTNLDRVTHQSQSSQPPAIRSGLSDAPSQNNVFRSAGPDSSQQDGAFRNNRPELSFQGSSFRSGGPESSIQGSSFRAGGRESSIQGSSFRAGGRELPIQGSSFRVNAPLSSFQGNFLQGNGPPSSLQGNSLRFSAPPSTFQGSSFMGSGPPSLQGSSFRGGVRDTTYRGDEFKTSLQGNQTQGPFNKYI